MPKVVQAGALVRAVEAIVAAGGSEPSEARRVAENLVTAPRFWNEISTWPPMMSVWHAAPPR